MSKITFSKIPYCLTLITIYAVSRISSDDGHNVYYAYFSTRELAKQYLNSFPDGNIVPIERYIDHRTGNFYDVTIRPLDVDMPNKHDVLSKLTDKEKKVLGF